MNGGKKGPKTEKEYCKILVSNPYIYHHLLDQTEENEIKYIGN